MEKQAFALLTQQKKIYNKETDMRISHSNDALVLENELFRLEFSAKTGGFPSHLGFSDEQQPRFLSEQSMLSAQRDGKKILPFVKHFAPEPVRQADHVDVLFSNISWQDENEKLMPDYRTDLRYEVYEDGVIFLTVFFFTETFTPGVIGDFRLDMDFSLADNEGADWAYWKFPASVDAAIIQDYGSFERCIPTGENRHADKMILPFVSFDFGKAGCRNKHAEFFVESWNSLTADYHNTETSISWRENQKSANLSWNFQKQPRAVVQGRTYQWRNICGWALRRAPLERRPPYRIFHHFDNFERYPDREMLQSAADEGCNLFILHENWRQDMKQGEFPHDTAALKTVSETCRELNMRLALYVRGNEDGIREDYGAHLQRWLQHDWDGIYMDYGGAVCFHERNENAPGGRICFRLFDRKMRRVRDFVGGKGVFISHTGSFFSALGHTVVDTYLGGEQEQGRLLENQTVHSYFSGVSVAAPSLWTGAFPTYRSRKMLPFLATTGQAPFLHLGSQLKSSSLAHPKSPAATTFARPLWRLWEMLDTSADAFFYSTQTTPELFAVDSSDTGASLWIDNSGNRLLIGSNFRNVQRNISVGVNWSDLQLTPPRNVVALYPSWQTNKWENISSSARFERLAEPHGLAGWIWTESGKVPEGILANFCRPYPEGGSRLDEHNQYVQQLIRKRFEPCAWPQVYLRVCLPPFPNSYEDSIFWDLYANDIMLQDVTVATEPRRLGYLSEQGLLETAEKGRLQPGCCTKWIPLHQVLEVKEGEQEFTLALVTERNGGHFYSFVTAEISPVPSEHSDAYRIEYCNDIDPDWSQLLFKIAIEK